MFAVGCHVGRVDPSDMAVRTTIYNVDAAMSRMTENDDGSAG